MIIALAGNQNSGKTTLFNQLTGAKQHVGNFPGVTVEKKEALVRFRDEHARHHHHHYHNPNDDHARHHHYRDRPGGGDSRRDEHMRHREAARGITLVDLPGIYSLSPYTQEEIVTRDFIMRDRPDAIIDIVDVMNIERGLYLSLQLMQLDTPLVIALNMMDELYDNHGSVEINALSERLGVPVVPISASKNEGVGELIEVVFKTAFERRKPSVVDFCAGAVHRAIHAVAHLIEDHAASINIPLRFAATKIIEGDELLAGSLRLTEHERHTIDETVFDMEQEAGTDRKAAIADMRYAFIGEAVAATVEKPHVTRHMDRSVRIDRLLTHKYFGIPIFIAIMALIFWLTFSVIGAWLSDLVGAGIELLGESAAAGLSAAGVNPVVRSFVSDAVFGGVGSVITFIPMIIIMFFLMSILEDSGYMARVAFIMDKLLRKLGLSGRSIVPMILGFGCTVPAVMSTRTLPSERDRKLTIMLTPFMSCTAKLPIFGMFAAAFFMHYRGIIVLSLYLMGILIAIIIGLILNRFFMRGKPIPFIMELPTYRFPHIKSSALLMWERTKDFLQRAFTIIFVATCVIWFLQSFDVRLNPVQGGSDSMLSAIGNIIAPVFAPLGFGIGICATALIVGFIAKEAVISSLAVLTGASSVAVMQEMLPTYFTPLTAYTFLVFCLIYTPCVAAISVVKRELGGAAAFAIVVRQTMLAWVIAFVVYRVGMLLGF